ncbi:IclR family transcriptional regulator [Sodalis sp. RH24]|uniref:IclR family transcriptional regulator n=1 Tax=unclassified Sodalis (in: enterobacteria) TaxID=2636512 RepID=UPI003965CF40
MNTPSQEYKAPALTRGLKIIEYFAKTGAPKSMGQLAAELGLSFNHIYRIVQCLSAEGYLYQDAARLYHLTDKVQVKYAVSPIQQFALSEQCQRLMRDFSWQTNQPCHLASLKEDDFVVLAHAYPEFSPAIGARAGATLNAVKSSSALLFLAMASDQAALRLIRHAPLGPELRANLHQQLAQIGEQGFSEIKHDRIIGLTSVSFPVLGHDDRAEAVITCPHFDHVPGDYDELKKSLRELASALTQMYRR